MINAELIFLPAPSAPANDAFTLVVAAEVGGARSLMVVDTGATETLVARPLAERLGLSLAPAPEGVDHAGRGVPTWTAGATLPLVFARGEVGLAAAAVVDLPDALQKMGIGGILSPQTLAGSTEVSLDFVGRRMRAGPGAAEAGAAEAGAALGSAPRVTLTLDRIHLPDDDAALLVFAARLPGDGEIAVMINTGAWEAELSPRTRAEAAASGKGLSGASVRGTRVRERALEINNVVVPLPDVLLRPQHDGLGGQIGTQVLQYTVLVLPAGGEQLCLSVPAIWVRRHRV